MAIVDTGGSIYKGNPLGRAIVVSLSSIIMVLLSMAAIGGTAGMADPTGKTFYLRNNVWYEQPENIKTVNFHAGTFISLGTKIVINKITAKDIRFHVENQDGQIYTLLFARKYSSDEETITDIFKKYFSEEDPFLEGGHYNIMSDEEKKSIRSGDIVEGMSRWAVLRSYGYPPTHKTPSLESTVWTYWINKFKKKMVYFENGKVKTIRNTMKP